MTRVSFFDESTYRQHNSDLSNPVPENGSAERHWWTVGRRAGRLPFFLSPASVAHRPEPRITVIMPVWNEERYLSQAIESVLKQTQEDLELIVVDDGSTDQSPEILWQWAVREPRIRLLWKNNGGTGSALNTGFAYARGSLQTWVAADSWILPHCLAKLQEALEANTQAVLAYGDWILVNDRTKSEDIISAPEFDKKLLQRDCYLGPAWLFRRTAKELVGSYSEEICEDYDMHLRMAEVGPFVKVSQPLATWRDHPNNLTNRINNPQGWRLSSRVKARHRWRMATYKVAYVCPSIDAAGVGWQLCRGLNDLSEHFAARHISGATTHLEAGHDLQFGHDNDEISRVLEECDLIHCNREFPDAKHLGFDLRPHLHKPLILHFHGGSWQWQLAKTSEFQDRYGATILSCAPFIGARVKGARWAPNYLPIPRSGHLWDSEFYRPAVDWPRESPIIRFLCHHNYRPGKGTLEISEMFRTLSEEAEFGFSGEWSVLGEPKYRLRDHLRLKQSFDVCVDQITHGFIGMAGWEAMAQGMAVIARVDEFAQSAYRHLGDGESPPILNARWIDEVASQVLDLAKNREKVNELGRQGREWMLRYYDAERIIGLYENFYSEKLHGPIQ